MEILSKRPNLLYLIVKVDFESVCDFVLTGSIVERKTLFAFLANMTNLYKAMYCHKMLLLGRDLLIPTSSNNNNILHICMMDNLKYRFKRFKK